MNRQFFTLTIPGGGIRPIEQPGLCFSVVTAATVVDIKWYGTDWGAYEQGDGEDMRGTDGFKRLEIRNPTVNPVTVVIYVGDAMRVSQRVAIMEPRTRFHAWSGTDIAAGASVVFSGPHAATDLRRKAILVSNDDPALPLYVGDAAGNIGHTVLAQTSSTLPISENVTIHNPAGSAVACRIGEIWWQV